MYFCCSIKTGHVLVYTRIQIFTFSVNRSIENPLINFIYCDGHWSHVSLRS